MKLDYYKALIARHGFDNGVPISVTPSASFWGSEAEARAHYGDSFIRLCDDNVMTIDTGNEDSDG